MSVVAWVKAPSAAVRRSSNSISETGGGMVRKRSTIWRIPPWYSRSCRALVHQAMEVV